VQAGSDAQGRAYQQFGASDEQSQAESQLQQAEGG